MNVAQDLKDYLVGAGLTTADKIFVSRMPTVKLTENDQWVIFAQAGSKSGGNLVQWKRKHNVVIAYRNKSGVALYNKDDELQARLEACVSLEHYKVLRVICNPMSELPIGTNAVHVGQWQITLELVNKPSEESI